MVAKGLASAQVATLLPRPHWIIYQCEWSSARVLLTQRCPA